MSSNPLIPSSYGFSHIAAACGNVRLAKTMHTKKEATLMCRNHCFPLLFSANALPVGRHTGTCLGKSRSPLGEHKTGRLGEVWLGYLLLHQPFMCSLAVFIC